MKNISIVMPVFNKVLYTISAINSLCSIPEIELIIIDNASTDNTQEEIKKLNKNNIVYIKNNENLFHSEACNQGYRLASNKTVLFLNNDIKVSSNDWISNLIDKSNDYIVSPTMGQLDDKLNFVREANEELKGYSYLSGWCISSSKDNWNKLDIDGTGQIWNEKYPFYFNDVDLSFRARKANVPLKVIGLPIGHFKKVSAKQLNIPKLYAEGREVFLKDWKHLMK